MELQCAFDHALDQLGPFEDQPHLAVAVSGGSDSVALALLTQNWVRQHQGQIICLIVDHGLRTESAQEAKEVQQNLASHELKSFILSWNDEKPVNRIQEKARQVRYHLLQQWCFSHSVLHLLIGHHQEDQRETYQLRQSKDSGPLGLSAMSSLVETAEVRLLRPLLSFTKQQLRTYLKNRHAHYVEDPSNQNPRYSRSILRQRPLSSFEENLIFESCQKYGLSRLQEETYTNRLVSQCVYVSPLGYGTVSENFFKDLNVKDQTRVLQRCLMTFGSGDHSPSRKSLENLRKYLNRNTFAFPKTLHGCMVLQYHDRFCFARELSAIKIKNLGLKKSFWWDQRFKVFLSNPELYETLAPLTEQGWYQLKQNSEDCIKLSFLKSLPVSVRFGLPALWKESRCLEVMIPKGSYDFFKKNCEFTSREQYDIHFAPRYPLTRLTFMIV